MAANRGMANSHLLLFGQKVLLFVNCQTGVG
jgi:hypothetical protein